MHRLFAYTGNDLSLTARALAPDRDALCVGGKRDPAGGGIGYIQEGSALVRRRPSMGQRPFDFAALASDTPSRTVIGAALTGDLRTKTQTNGIPPFRFRFWLATMAPRVDGSIPAAARERLMATMPDHIRRSLEGRSDAELLSKSFLAAMHERSNMRLPDYPRDAMVEAIQAHTSELQAAFADQAANDDLSLIVSNGRAMAVSCDKAPVSYRWIDGLPDVPKDEDALSLRHVQRDTTHFRGLVVVTGDAPARYTAMQPGTLMTYQHGDDAPQFAHAAA